jgi:diacylglycerol kinase (ATP)
MTQRRFALIVNPRGGTRRGLAVLEQVRPLFAAAQATLDVHVTTGAGHAAQLARSLDLAALDGVCLIGGDGTIQEVVDGLLQRREPPAVPLGVIPGGTGNTVLWHLGCDDVQEAARRILAGQTVPIDVARVTMPDQCTHCVNIIGWGAAVDINRVAERLRWLGPPRYRLAAAWHILRARSHHARLVLDGREQEDDFQMVVACNTKFTGKGMRLAPLAELADGKLDVIVVRGASRWQMLRLFQRVFDGSHLTLDCVEYHQVQSFRIETPGREPLNLDGELKGSSPVSVDLLPAALRLFA